MIRAVLFDLDGVLVEFAGSHFEALNIALQEICGRPVGLEERERFEGLSTRQKLSMMIAEGRISGEAQAQEVYRLKQEHTMRLVSVRVEPDREKVMMCRALAESLMLACVSNCVRASVDVLLHRAGLRQYMLATVSNEDVAHPKPAPDSYLLACKLLALRPDQALAVEDNNKGVASAVAAGVPFLQIDYPEVNLASMMEAINAANNGDLRCRS